MEFLCDGLSKSRCILLVYIIPINYFKLSSTARSHTYETFESLSFWCDSIGMLQYPYPLSFIYMKMFIYNIIYKLPIIIYKSKIICKGYNNPYKQRPTVKLYSYKYQVSLNPIHCIAHPSSVSIVAPICIYFLIYPNSCGNTTYALVYMDDIILTGNNSVLIQQLISQLNSIFSLGICLLSH